MWKPPPKRCQKCGLPKGRNGFDYCEKCRKEITNMIRNSTLLCRITNKVSCIDKKVSWLKSAIKFVVRPAIRIIVKFYKWKNRREEERDVECLINKARG